MNSQICLRIFIQITASGFVIILVYIDNLNIIRTQDEIHKATNYLKKESERMWYSINCNTYFNYKKNIVKSPFLITSFILLFSHKK